MSNNVKTIGAGIAAAFALAGVAHSQTASSDPAEGGILKGPNNTEYLATITNPGPTQTVTITSIGNAPLTAGETVKGVVKGLDGNPAQFVSGTVTDGSCGCLTIKTKNLTTGSAWHSPAPITVSPSQNLSNIVNNSATATALATATQHQQQTQNQSQIANGGAGGNGYGGAGGNVSIRNPGSTPLGGFASSSFASAGGLSCQDFHSKPGIGLSIGTLTGTGGVQFNGKVDSHTNMADCGLIVLHSQQVIEDGHNLASIRIADINAGAQIAANVHGCHSQAVVVSQVLDFDDKTAKALADAADKDCPATAPTPVAATAPVVVYRDRPVTHALSRAHRPHPKPVCPCAKAAVASGPNH